MSGVATGIRRNMTMTVALVLNTAITLFFVGGSILASREINKFKHDYEGKLNVSVFLCTKPIPGAAALDRKCRVRYSDAQRTALEQQFAKDPIITASTFISEADAVARYRKTVPPIVARNTAVGDLPASFTIKLRDIKKDYARFVAEYQNQPGVSGTSTQSNVLKTLLDVIGRVRLGSFVLAIVVLIASILLIANSIQVAAAQRKNETSIMRLVGASRWMTELPFMIETIIATFVGGLIALGLITLGKQYTLNNIFKVPVQNGVIPNLDANDVLIAGGLGLIAGLVLSALTAFATLRLYVKL
jgi:cell division transport system permease protein